MIARYWRGSTTREHAQAYEILLRNKILPRLDQIDGYRGVYLLKRETEDGFEFATLTLWESMEAVQAFAGDDHEKAVVPADARAVLAKFDERSTHFEVVESPGDD